MTPAGLPSQQARQLARSGACVSDPLPYTTTGSGATSGVRIKKQTKLRGIMANGPVALACAIPYCFSWGESVLS